jgi:hypothetical protein
VKRKRLRFGRGFRVVLGNRRSQAAEMVVIRNTGRGMLCTLNVYVPPAYDTKGDELPRGKR